MPRLYQRGQYTKHALELLSAEKQMTTHEIAERMGTSANTARMTMFHLQRQSHVFMVSAGSRTKNRTRPAVWSLACHRTPEPIQI